MLSGGAAEIAIYDGMEGSVESSGTGRR